MHLPIIYQFIQNSCKKIVKNALSSTKNHIKIKTFLSNFSVNCLNFKKPEFPPMSASSQTAKPPQQTVTLSTHIELVVRQYFRNLGNETPSGLYDIMLQQLEKPLLKVVLEQTRGNQSKTAEILGLNRGTLRKKLKTHGLD